MDRAALCVLLELLDRCCRYRAAAMHPKRKEFPDAKCPKLTHKDLRAMVETAWAAGWWCEATGSGHYKCFSIPDPGSRGRIVNVPSTPSDRRTIPNTRAEFRRAGLEL